MHLQLRVIYFISIVLFIFHCETPITRLADPVTSEDSAKQGIVAFGIYFCTIDDGYLNFSELRFQRPCIAIRDITIVEIVSIDHKNKKIVTLPSTLKDDFVDIKNRRARYFTDANEIHTILLQDVNKKYAIESFRILVSVIPGSNKKYILRCPLNVYESFKALPIQANAKEIKFQGIFNNGDGLIRPNPESPICSIDDGFRILESDGWRTSIVKGDSFVSKHDLSYFEEIYYLGKKVEPKNAELKFLRDFIDVQKEGYWKLKAEERLAALGYKYENGFVIEVEAKKK
jgi:hypothetical protein